MAAHFKSSEDMVINGILLKRDLFLGKMIHLCSMTGSGHYGLTLSDWIGLTHFDS